MPQVQVINTAREERQPSPVNEMFSRLQKDYKEREDKDVIGNLIGEYQKNRQNAFAWEDLQLGLEKSNISPSKRLETQKSLNEMKSNIINQDKLLNEKAKVDIDKIKKEEAETVKANEALKKENQAREKVEAREKEVEQIYINAGADPEEAARKAKFMSPASARAEVKPAGKGAKEKFEETLAYEGAKEIPKLEQAVAKGKDTLTNIARVGELAEDLRGPLGYGKALLNTESAAELTTLGATNLDTVIKLFNPAGTLPTAKLNWIRSTFSLSPSDNYSTMKGKINTQKMVAEQSLKRAQDRVDLLKKYYGNIPPDVAKKFDDETVDILDNLEKEVSPKKESSEKKPKEGMVRVKNKETGQTGYVTPYAGMEKKYDTISE